MKVATPEQMRAIDQEAIESYGMPPAALMESAGAALADRVADQWDRRVAGRRVHVLCGGGNNGGDGLVAARRLLNLGARVRVYLASSVEHLREPVASFARVLARMGTTPQVLSDETLPRLSLTLGTADCIVDALLGTGARGPARGRYAPAIRAINEAGRPVIAADVPSGLDADRGAAPGEVVRATLTVTFGLPKQGLLLYPGASLAGKLVVADIGLPGPLLESPDTVWLRRAAVRPWLPNRPATSHKGDFGRVLMVAGAAGMAGAAALAAKGALRAGAGLCTWAGPERLLPVMMAKLTEVMTRPLAEGAIGRLGPEAETDLCEAAASQDVVGIGPGIGRDPGTVELVRAVLPQLRRALVLDADALYAIAGWDQGPSRRDQAAPWILTPHAGEAARLLGTTREQIDADRPGAARRLAERWRAVVVLKGAPTLVADPGGRLAINATGNSGLATGGTGDVLTGVVAGMLAQGFPPFEAACLGVHLHGAAADELTRVHGAAGWLAGDLLAGLPAARRRLQEGSAAL